MLIRNLKILKDLISKYPEKNWNILNLTFGIINPKLYYLNKKYKKQILKQILVPLEIIIYQLKHSNFNLLNNNSNPNSITCLDWVFSKLFLSKHFNIDLFLNLFENNIQFQTYIYESDKNLNKKKIYSLLCLKRKLIPFLIENENNLNNELNIELDWNNISLNTHLNIDILKLYKNKSWNFDFLLKNRKLTYEWIQLFDRDKWNWKHISGLKILKLDWILDNLELDTNLKWKWNFNKITNSNYFQLDWLYELKLKGIELNIYNMNLELCNNFEIEWISILKNKYSYYKYEWNFKKISKNKNFRVYWLNLYPNENWDWRFILKNKYINIHILRHLKKENRHELSIEKNPYFNFNWTLEFPNNKWSSLYYLSSKINIPIEYLKNNLNERWNYKYILLNTKLDMDLILKIKNVYKISTIYFWNLVSNNKYFDFNWLKHNEIDWNFYDGISNLSHLTINIIKEYKYKKWNILKIINHKNILVEDFQTIIELFSNSNSNSNSNLSISNFSQNPNLTLEFIENNITEIDFNLLSNNSFNGLYYKNKKNIYKKKNQLKIYENELIERSWHPSRFLNWCLDMDEYKRIKNIKTIFTI